MNRLAELAVRYDAIVVGARCAGAATALLLARRGLRVLMVERGRYGTDTLSTHALMRGGVLQLVRWGLLPALEAAGTPPVRTTSFHYGEEVLPLPIKPRNGVDALYAPRRTVLDRLLVDTARDAGVEVMHGVRIADLIRSNGRVRGALLEDVGGAASVAADIVIGADGLKSTVARLAGAEPYRVGSHAAGIVYGYWSGLDVEGYGWYYRPGVSIGVIPTNDGEVCVFAAAPARRFASEIRLDIPSGYHRVLHECSPRFAETVGRATSSGPLRGFPGEIGYFRRSHGPGWALVGDAGYFKDPITAHGITDALRDAELLAIAVAKGTEPALAEYERLRDELSAGVFEVTDRIASFEWDLAEVQKQHRRLSEEMAREVEWLSALQPYPPAGLSRAQRSEHARDNTRTGDGEEVATLRRARAQSTP
jgi:menaquinone-9 beta-reductase